MNKFGLRECPFCGDENTVLFEKKDTDVTAYGVACLNCRAMLGFTAKNMAIESQPFTSIKKTQEAWNRRKGEQES